MKINWVGYQVGAELKAINNGGCFLHKDVLYIKTDIEEPQLNNDFTKITVVDLENGIVDYLFSDTLVMPIDAEIRINGN